MTALYDCRIACETPFGYTLFIRTDVKNYNYFQFILSKASCCSQVGNSSPRSLVKLLLATLNNAFDSPLLERTTTSVENPTRKNSWIRQLVLDCSKSHLLLLLFALFKSVASLVVWSDIFPCRSQDIPIKNTEVVEGPVSNMFARVAT
jgi:hypothetical protein